MLLHEVLHYFTARLLGYEATITFSKEYTIPAFCVNIPLFSGYKTVSDMPGFLKRDYITIAIVPYITLIPIAIIMISSNSIYLHILGLLTLLIQIGSLPLEFLQYESTSRGVLSGIVIQILLVLTLVFLQ